MLSEMDEELVGDLSTTKILQDVQSIVTSKSKVKCSYHLQCCLFLLFFKMQTNHGVQN